MHVPQHRMVDDKKINDQEEAERIIQVDPLVPYVMSKFRMAETQRQEKASQWAKNLRAVRGQDSETPIRPESEVAKIYVRTTATKTKAAYAQINEALLSGDKFPVAVMPTSMPTGISEYAHVDPEAVQKKMATEQQASESLDVGFEGDGVELEPGATMSDVTKSVIGAAYNVALEEEMFVDGVDITGGVNLTPAKASAIKMEKMIHDQLEESMARAELRRALYEQCMLGTGVMKGPFTATKTSNSWKEGKWMPETTDVPKLKFVSLWDIYVDPNAYRQEDIEYVIERHRMNPTQLAELIGQPAFRQDAIERLYQGGGNYQQRTYDNEVHDNNITGEEQNLFEVFEFWGYMSSLEAKFTYGLEVPESAGASVQVNVWVSGGEVLRLAVNPFKPARIPYFLFPYEEDPYSVFGTGIPELMEDLQYLMNGMTRLAVENAMYAGNVILEIDKSLLSADEDMALHPGKIFSREHGAVGNAINSVQIPFVAHQNMQMFSLFRQMADEATGIQSISHGQTGVSGTGRTAQGLSMLLEGASLSIKNVIRNVDEHLLKPLAISFFQWNMQFNSEKHPGIKGDLEIKPMGAFNMTAKERKAQSLQTFLQLSTNQAVAPLIKLPVIVKELAIQMGIDPEEILNSTDEIMAYAQLQQLINPQGQQAQGGISGDIPSEEGTGNNAGAGNPEGINGQQTPEGTL